MLTNVILSVLFVHWVADFVCQTQWMAINKSKNNWALGVHVLVYGFVTYNLFWLINYFFLDAFSTLTLAVWTVVNMALHAIVDYNTSRVTSKLWAEQKTHNFFVMIGFDQFIHYVCLFVTLKFI